MEKLSDEELVLRIQNGETQLIETLWNQVKGLVTWKAKKFYFGFPHRAEMGDYIHSGFLAMVSAIKKYRHIDGGFSFAHLLLQESVTQFRKIAGIHTLYKADGPEVHFDLLMDARSLDAPIKSSSDKISDQSFGDTIIDHKTEYTIRDLEDRLSIQKDADAVRNAMKRFLPQRTQELIERFFVQGESIDSLAQAYHSTKRGISSPLYRGVELLRELPELQSLKSGYIDRNTNFYHSKGVSAFLSDHISVVENQVEYREHLAESYLKNHPRAKWSKEDLISVILMYKNGKTPTYIGKHFSTSRDTVQKVIRELCSNVTIPKIPSQAERRRKKAIKLFSEGHNRKEISKLLNMDYTCVCGAVKAVSEPRQKEISKDVIQKIIQLRNDGMKKADIAKQIGVCHSSVEKYLDQAKREGKLKVPDKYSKYNDETISQIKSYLDSGLTRHKISDIMKIPYTTLQRLVKNRIIKPNEMR